MSQGCWTCRGRKIRCDLGLPTCSNCCRSKRRCLGYGLKLSWPDERRRGAKVHNSLHFKATGAKETGHFFLNVSSHDIRLFHNVSSARAVQVATDISPWHPPMLRPVSLSLIDEQDSMLVDYYTKSGASLFKSIQGDVLAPFLLKLALSDAVASSKAVLHAILALSCLHLRLDVQAQTHKASAISLLSASLQAGADAKVAFQNLATSMLLCTYETADPSMNWGTYICGVKTIIVDALERRVIRDHELFALRGWIYFNEVLARFSVLHWASNPDRLPICYEGPKSSSIQISRGLLSQETYTLGYSQATFDSISSICDTLLPSTRSPLTVIERHNRVHDIERVIRSFDNCSLDRGSETLDLRPSKPEIIRQLYQLATLIYFNRAVISYTGREPQHINVVEVALTLLSQVKPSEAPWPLFIISCEAVTDIQRRQVLHILAEPQVEGRWEHFMLIRKMVEAAWNQDDLHTDGLDYFTKLSVVISLSPFLPAFT